MNIISITFAEIRTVIRLSSTKSSNMKKQKDKNSFGPGSNQRPHGINGLQLQPCTLPTELPKVMRRRDILSYIIPCFATLLTGLSLLTLELPTFTAKAAGARATRVGNIFGRLVVPRLASIEIEILQDITTYMIHQNIDALGSCHFQIVFPFSSWKTTSSLSS